MRRKFIIISVLFVGLLFASGYRFWQLRIFPCGPGVEVESPDGQFVASADSLMDYHFFGGKRNYYDFSITRKGGQKIQDIVIEEPLEGMIDWGVGHDDIEWTADSSSVRYRFKGTELILKTKP